MIQNEIYLIETRHLLFFIILCGFMGLFLLLVQTVFGSFPFADVNNNKDKHGAYECGFDPFEDARMRFDVRYYLVAILFLLFDIELVYLLPWSVFLPILSSYAFWNVQLFMILILVGFIFEYSVNALSWQSV